MIGVISSTEVRRRIAIYSDRPFFGVAGLISPSVLKYIQQHQLYMKTSPAAIQEKAKEKSKDMVLKKSYSLSISDLKGDIYMKEPALKQSSSTM